ncbi:MAG TPA: dihydrofolate reductase family protein [Bacillota bacterium]|nr:dihydrofolate reductase family protein [Bacillota bacterium]
MAQRVRVHNLSLSLDGYTAGPDQDAANPLGVGGPLLHEWIFATQTGQAMLGGSGGQTGIDDDFARQGFEGIGATVIGRNMFGPVRGPWGNSDWRGWWGEEPPYHHPVFVVTHHTRSPLVMKGGTTFHFVTEGVEVALQRALETARGADVGVGGGASTIRQLLQAGRIDELHLAVVPVLLRSGERLFAEPREVPTGYECVRFVGSDAVAHYVLQRKDA